MGLPVWQPEGDAESELSAAIGFAVYMTVVLLVHRLECCSPFTHEVGWLLCSLPACIMPSEPQLPEFMTVYPESLSSMLDKCTH